MQAIYFNYTDTYPCTLHLIYKLKIWKLKIVKDLINEQVFLTLQHEIHYFIWNMVHLTF